MKNLLNYQTTEYDCGPVSILNGIRYLFEREEIFPDLVKFIMLYCMDTYNEAGELCKHGTSPAAMSYMTCWLNHFSERKNFPLRCEHYSGDTVSLTPGSPIWQALEKGGVVVLYLYLDVGHYVLLTGLEDERVLLSTLFTRRRTTRIWIRNMPRMKLLLSATSQRQQTAALPSAA